jgi:hypothetical protein
MNENEIMAELQNLRVQWRRTRGLKLSRKRELLSRGTEIAGVRHDRDYKNQKKTQHNLAKLIRHLECRLNGKRDRSEA